MSSDIDEGGRRPTLIGRRGGRTTMTAAKERHTLWIDRDAAEALRAEAKRTGRSQASLVREGLRRFLDIED